MFFFFRDDGCCRPVVTVCDSVTGLKVPTDDGSHGVRENADFGFNPGVGGEGWVTKQQGRMHSVLAMFFVCCLSLRYGVGGRWGRGGSRIHDLSEFPLISEDFLRIPFGISSDCSPSRSHPPPLHPELSDMMRLGYCYF